MRSLVVVRLVVASLLAITLCTLLQYAPWLATSYVAWAGILVGFAGLVSVIRPLRWTGIATRRCGAVVLGAGALVAVSAIAWPASFEQSRTSDRRLDRFLSDYQFSEYHEVRTHAPVARVEAAMREVSFADIPVAMYLMRARAGFRGGPAGPMASRPILDLMATPGTGFFPLDTSDPRELVYGMAGAPWASGRIAVRSPEQFLAYTPTATSGSPSTCASWRKEMASCVSPPRHARGGTTPPPSARSPATGVSSTRAVRSSAASGWRPSSPRPSTAE